jgi:hypothetical protein
MKTAFSSDPRTTALNWGLLLIGILVVTPSFCYIAGL